MALPCLQMGGLLSVRGRRCLIPGLCWCCAANAPALPRPPCCPQRGGASNPFQSAKSKLISDMRKSGQPINPAYLQQQPGGGPPPRQGLLRPGGRGGLGGRRPMAAGGRGQSWRGQRCCLV